MDLKSLKRRELQALCKKHGIPGNSTSSQLIESLSSILEDHNKAKPKGCMKGSGGSGVEDLGIVGGVSKKKVTFVVEDGGEEEFEEITRSPVGDSKGKVTGNKRRSTRSGGLPEAVMWSPVIAKTKKKSLTVGMQGVRQNDKLISGEVQTTRLLRNRAVVVGADEELVTDETSRRIQGRKSIAEEKVTIVTEAEDEGKEVEGITTNPARNSKRKSVASVAVEIKGRSTRSRHLVEAVVSSPDIEKKKKGLSVGTEGGRQNDKLISNEVATTRSLRNSVVVVGDEELATDQNSRRTQKRKNSDKNEENEMEASKMEEDEFVGKKNLRKRSRDEDFVGGEAPNRRSTRSNNTKSEENVAIEEVDVGGSNKRRRKDIDGLIIEKGVDEDIERANRTKRMVVKSDATESRDVDNAGGQKKVQSKGKTRASKGGDATISTLDSEILTLPGRRSTRSAPLVGTSDEEAKAVKKGKLQKHVKNGEASEFVSEPARKSTRSSSTLREDETSLPFPGVEEVRTGKSLKQAKHHGSEGVDVIAEPIRKSIRSSDVGKSDGDGQAIKKGRSRKRGLLDSKVVVKPAKKSTRTSSSLQEDEASLLVERPVSVDEAVKKSKSQKQAKTRGSKGGSSTTSLRDSETIVEPVRRSTHNSSALLEDITSLPAVEVVKEVKSHKQGGKGRPSKGQAAPLSQLSDNEATPTRRSARSSKSLEDEAHLSTRRPTHSSSKLLEDGSFLEAVSKDKPGKKSRSSALKEGGSRVLVSESPVVAESVRGSTRSSMEHISSEVETSLPVSAKLDDEVCARTMEHSVPSNVVEGVIGKIDLSALDVSAPRHSGSNEILLSMSDSSGDEAEKVGRRTLEQREDDLKGQISEAFVSNFKAESQTEALEEHEQFKELPKGSVQSASNKNVLAGDKDEDSKSDGAIPVSGPPIADVSVNLSIDMESGKAEAEFNDIDDKNAPEIGKSLAEVEKGTSLVGSAKDLDDEINGNESSVFELASKGSGALLVNVEGSSEIEENVSRQLGCSDVVPIEPSSTVEVNTELTSDSASTPSKVSKEFSTFDPEISTMALPKEPEPDSMVEVGIEREDIISGYEAVHGSSSQLPRSSEELSLRTDSRDYFGIDLEEPNLKAEIRGTNEDGLEYGGESDMAVPTLVCTSSEEPTLAAVTGAEADQEIDIKEHVSKAEDDSPHEDVVPDNDAVNIFDPTTSDTKVYSDSCTSRGTELEEPGLKMEICGATEDGLDNNEETDIVVQTSVCESSEELTLTLVTVANPETDLKEPDSKVEVDRPSKDIVGDDESKKILDPTISDAEICLDSLTSRGTDLEDPWLEAEICGANEAGLDDNEETDIVVQTLVCESSKLTSTSVTVANPEIDIKELDSNVGVDHPNENIVGDDEAKTIDDPMISDAEICLDSPTTRGIDLEEPRLEAEICGANEDDLDDNEETDIVVQTSVCESSEELTLTPVTVANPEIELKEPDSKVEVDRPSEDIVGDDEAKKIFDPMTSDTDVYSHSPTSRGTDLEEPRLVEEICGANEDGLQDDEKTDTVVQTSVCQSSEELTLTSVTVDNPEIDLKEPDSKVEVDHPSEDIVRDDEAKKIFDPMASDIEVCSDSRTSWGTDLEETRLEAEIYGADEDIQEDEDSDEDSLQDDEGTYIVEQTLICKSSELASVTVSNPDFDLKEPYSEVEVDCRSEDIEGDDEAKKISDPLTSDTEFCAEPLCDVNVEVSYSQVEVHHASKGYMEQNEATTSVSSVMSCKSTGVLSPTTLNEASYISDREQVDTPAMNKEGLLIEARSIHSKTSEASVTVDRNPGDTSGTQRIFDNEMENFKANPDTVLNSHLEHAECDIAKKIEAVACDKDPQLYEEDMEVSKETWVTSMVSVTVNDGIIEDDSKDVVKNEDELASSSPRENQPVQRPRSSTEELEDADQSDFTQSLYDKEPADAERKLTLERKDEPFALEIADVSPVVTEDKYSVDHRSSTQLLDAGSKSEKQMEDYELCDADEGSNGCSASSNENSSPTNAVLFGDAEEVVEQGAFPTLPVTFTRGEEILPTSSTEAPTLLGNEGSAMQVDIQDFSYVRDNDDGKNVSDPQEVTVNATENLTVDFEDRSSKSPAKEHVDVELLSSNSDALPETSITVNKLTDVEFERNIEFGVVVSEEMNDIVSWECEANAEGYDGTEEDSIESDKVDHLDDVDQKQDDAFFHEIKCFSGELHTDENASHTSVNDSASGSAEERVWLHEKVSSSTCMGNAPSSSKMDIVLPYEEHLDKDFSEKTSAEDGANVIPSANQQECQDTDLEHAGDDNISMDQYFEVEDEQSNKFQGTFGSFFPGTFDSFEHDSNAEDENLSEQRKEKTHDQNEDSSGRAPNTPYYRKL